MKAGIFFSGSGPILVLTTYPELRDPKLVEKLDDAHRIFLNFPFAELREPIFHEP